MIRSMTAYAAAECNGAWGTLGAELRAVNHRYLELSLRLPEELRVFEPYIREQVAARISRGKLELGMRVRGMPQAASGIRINQVRLAELAEAQKTVAAGLSTAPSDFIEVLKYPGVVEEAPIDMDGLERDVHEVLASLLDSFIDARAREGEKLAAVMRSRLDSIDELLRQLRVWMPEIREQLQTRLRARLAELAQAADNGRLEQELVIGLQKMDVEEELDRLDTHVSEARRVLGLDEAVGRRLDFLLQEFNREANTLGSKSVDSRTSQAAVELKVLIEQIREQVQNLE